MPTNLTLETFVDKLLDEKFPGVAIPSKRRYAMKQEMIAALNKLISLKMLEQLSPEEMQEFQRLEEANATDDQLQQYIADQVGPKLKEKDVFLAHILGEFRELYLGPPTQ